MTVFNNMGHEVAHLVEALCYKLEGRQFYSRLYYLNFCWYNLSDRTMNIGVDSNSNRNE
jgi:hypothetical protein